MSVRKNSVASVAPSEAPQVDQGSPAQDRRSEVIHPDDHEVALQRSISNAIITAMGSMSSALTQSISQALMARPATTTQVLVPPPGPPPIVSRTPQIDGPSPSQDNALQSRKRACTRQAEKTRAWKTARSLPEPRSDSDRESEEETHDNVYELTDEVEDDLADIAVDPVRNLDPEAPLLQQGSAEDLLLDPSGEPLFNPEELHHPRSAEWMPATHVAQYMEARIRNPLSKESRNKLRAECPRPLIPHKVCETPSVDPKMVQFLAKTGFNPRKGLDAALKAVQDKLLDITGPLAKIFDLAESAIAAGSQVDPIELRGWAQRAICVAGNTNTSLAIERRKAILIKIEPKLSNLALTEAGKDAQGLLFGDSFIKELGKYVGAFTALDKAQTSMRRVFQGRFSNRAGSARGRLSGRSNFHARGSGRGSFNYRASLQDQRHQPSFFPSRGAPFRSRGFRGNPGSRRPFGKLCSSSPSFFRPFSRGQTPILFSCVVRHNLRPMGPFYCAGVHNRSDCRSELHPSPPYGTTVLCGTVPISEGIVGSSAERRDRTRTGESWGCHQQYFPGAKEQFCTIPTFQDGGHPSFEGSAPSRRLVGQDRSPRRLSHGPSVPLFKRPAAVPVERSGLALHLPSVRPVLRPLVLYQDHAPSGGLASQQRCSSDRLPGRYLDHGPITGSLVETPPLDGDARFRLGVHCQPGEILFDPLQIHRVLGFPGELGRIIPQSSTLESQGYPQGVEACSTPTSDVVAAFGKDNRTSGLLNTGHFPSPPPLSCVAAPQNCSPSVGGLLRRFGLIRCRDDGRDEMVDPQPVSVEWQSDRGSPTGSDHRIRCEPARMGSTLQWCVHGRSMVSRRIPSSHQRPGTPSRVVCHSQFCQWCGQLSHQAPHGQYICGQVRQLYGWHTVGGSDPFGEGFLGILSRQEHLCGGRVPSRPSQHSGGLEFSLHIGLQRLEVRRDGFFCYFFSVGSLCSRPLRFPFEYPTAQVFQLEAGSLGGGSGRSASTLGRSVDVRIPSLRAHSTSAPSGSSAVGEPGSDCSVLENPVLVPSDPGTSSGLSVSPSHSGVTTPRACRRSSPTPAERVATPPSLQDIGSPGGGAGLSGTARFLLDCAWAPGTRRAYRAAWGSWSRWCVDRTLDPVTAPVNSILAFLSSLFEAGKAYRTINVFRSAISSRHNGVDGRPAGQHPLVCRLLKGSRLARPPRPRFSSTWDVSDVLQFLVSWPSNELLSLRQLSAKLVTLFCLISCKRVSDVRALDWDARSFTPEGVHFNISRRTKTSIRSVSYPRFPTSPQLCPVACLREYEDRTRPLRSLSLPHLFISFRSPFAPVTSVTLSRWVKWILSLSGIDTSIFTAHSVRSATATSMTLSGARLEDVMRLADWSRSSTFREFYFRPASHAFDSIVAQL
ncbi:uncharacterized protein LOC122932427 [Bufo gargarizans]|uniref:uncharacterized protein LOC122932427 n=1 Tax=Bufo gargarizans TaxID=30331 RepID=UPI001CF1A67A|nr:uncharacterized protein LOC122932427 [Bufo gargarizans]